MGLMKFLRETILLKQQEYKRGAIAPGTCFHRYFNRSFVVTAERFREITGAMEAAIDSCCPGQERTLIITADTGRAHQSTETTFENVDELATCFNAGHSRLNSVTCSLCTEDMGSVVVFENYPPGWTAAIVVEGGSNDSSQQLFGKLTDYVKETFQWYSFLTSGRVTLFASASYLMWSAYALWGYFGPTQSSPPAALPEPSEIPTVRWILEGLFGFVCVAGVIFVWILLMRTIDALFPKGIFLIGQEVHRHSSRLWWRKALLTSLVFPFLIVAYWTFVQ